MASKPIPYLAGILFLVAGVLFFVAAALGKQTAYYGIGAAFIVLGVGGLAKARADRRQGGA
jgi:uncharacterized membrane protein HdeD (DUF308 family)